RVGTTRTGGLRCGPVTVHPHARGDDDGERVLQADFHGTPPRAWGRRELADECRTDWRYTPTRVGTTRRRTAKRESRLLHPHARGDDPVRPAHRPPCSGTPPRAWGRRSFVVACWPLARYTPTRVG